MRCVYVGSFSPYYSSELYVAQALEGLGVEVIRFKESTRGKPQSIVQQILEYKPDFVLVCKARFWVMPKKIVEDLRQKVPVVAWIFDLYIGLPNEHGWRRSFRDAPFSANLVLTTDGGHDEEWKRLGINHKTLRQGIHLPDAHYGKPYPNEAPIVFVGSSLYPPRQRMLEKLNFHYSDKFNMYGEGTTVRGEDLNNLFASTKVVVGDSHPSPNYWSNRIYETLGRGGFLLHPRVNGLEKEFEYYKHFIPYDYGNVNQIIEITDYYLKHDSEREKIRKAGHEFVKKNYTYGHRCQELIKIVKKEFNL